MQSMQQQSLRPSEHLSRLWSYAYPLDPSRPILPPSFPAAQLERSQLAEGFFTAESARLFRMWYPFPRYPESIKGERGRA